MSKATSPQTKKWKLTRRQFLVGLGSGAAALAVGAFVGGPTMVREARLAINQAFLTGEAPMSDLPKSPFIWFELDAEGNSHLYIPKVEMGQGVHTALAQIAADELELDWQTVIVHQADTRRGFDPELIFTYGSTSVTSLYRPIREIAATMREMLRMEAARQWGVEVAQVTASQSTVRLTTDDTSALSYGALIQNKQGEWVIPEQAAALKPASEFRYIGQPVPRVDLRAKITGRAQYGFDMRAPNMAYGAVARPPRYNAMLKRAAAGTAAEQAGVIQVVIEPTLNFAGIVAASRAQAYAALAFLDLEWEGGTSISQDEIEQTVSVGGDDGILIQRRGDFQANLESGTVVEADYRIPMAAHAQMEPQGALADVQAAAVTVHASTQSPGLTQSFITRSTGIPAEQITVIPTLLGGAFGRKTGTDAALEAVILSRAVGRPVHVGWNRTEEMRYGYRRPPSNNVLRGAIDPNGRILALEHQVASSDVLFYVNELQDSRFLQTLLGADPLAAYGSLIHYNVPHHRVIYYHRDIPVPTAFWRGLGSFPNTFAIESFMDELAASAGVDPLQLRLDHLPEGALGDRFRVALETVAERSGWFTPAAADRARGVALCYDRGTVVALVVEVGVENNRIRVHQAWCAVDPGLIVNPDGATAQTQGSIMMALSSALHEEIIVTDGLVTADNFGMYPLLRLGEAPTVEVIPLQSREEPVGGLGEPVMGVVPPAVANAVFTLTGQRLRRMPFRLEG
jgi:isoquinoline 1-oxidoreductase beta subunit